MLVNMMKRYSNILKRSIRFYLITKKKLNENRITRKQKTIKNSLRPISIKSNVECQN